jgi:3,4-dihydroxy-2-butanone 4-phosphate synthase
VVDPPPNPTDGSPPPSAAPSVGVVAGSGSLAPRGAPVARQATIVTAAIVEAIARLRCGRPILLCDDVNREGEGDVLIGAEFASSDAINFMARYARGLICLALTPERCEALGLEPIGPGSGPQHGGVPMISIEAKEGVTTGISTADRARTIEVAVDPAATAEDLVQPGHVFPLRSSSGGLLECRGRTEAALHLTRSAGLRPAAVLCEVMSEDGHMASGEDLERFGSEHDLSLVSVSEVFEHRLGGRNLPAPSEGETKRLMRSVMGHFATGISVITANGRGGDPVGTTANAITSVSLEPPLLLACLAEESETLAAIRESGWFAVNVLSAEQRHHSDRFAAKGAEARPHEVEFESHELGLPVLPGSLATIACDLEAIHPAGDHEIVVGHARSLSHQKSRAEPLLFYRGGYSRLLLEGERGEGFSA